jgi:uncharacterized coiled-coil protein SlyX
MEKEEMEKKLRDLETKVELQTLQINELIPIHITEL